MCVWAGASVREGRSGRARERCEGKAGHQKQRRDETRAAAAADADALNSMYVPRCGHSVLCYAYLFLGWLPGLSCLPVLRVVSSSPLAPCLTIFFWLRSLLFFSSPLLCLHAHRQTRTHTEADSVWQNGRASCFSRARAVGNGVERRAGKGGSSYPGWSLWSLAAGMAGAGHAGTDGVVQLGVCYSPRAVLRRKGTNGIGNETAGVVKYFSGRLLWLLWCGQAVNYPLTTGGGCRLSATLVTALNRRSEEASLWFSRRACASTSTSATNGHARPQAGDDGGGEQDRDDDA